MSGRSRRSKSHYDLDYSVFHETGERVHKSPIMDLTKLKIKAKQLRNDICEHLRLYNLQDMDTLDEVLEGLDIVSETGKCYRHIHIELEVAMGETEYLAEYAKAGEITDKVRQYQADAKIKSRRLKQEESEKSTAKVLADREELELRSKMASLEVEEQVFRAKLNDEIDNFELGEISGVQNSCKRFEHLLDECYSLLSKAKIVFGNDFDTKYKDIFDESFSKIRAQIKLGSNKISELVSEERDCSAKEKAKEEEASNDKMLKELSSHAEILTNEIELRSKSLTTRCQSSVLQSLNDYDLLDCKKNMKYVDIEMREIMTKFS